MERRGRRGFWVAAGIAYGLIPDRPVCTDEGIYVPLDYEQRDGTISDNHPDELLPPALDFVRVAADAMDAGILMAPGTMLDQPSKLIAGIKIWRNSLRQAERLYHDRTRGA